MTSSKLNAAFDDFFKNAKKSYTNNGSKEETWEARAIENARRVPGTAAGIMLRRIGLDATRTEPFTLLDHACGTGVVADLIQVTVPRDVLEKSSILCADNAAQQVQVVQNRIPREEWINVEAKVLDAQKTDFPDASFTHVTSNLGFHIFPNPESALKDCIRVLKPGGTLAFTTPTGATIPFEADFKTAFASFPFDAPFPPWPKQLHDMGDYSDASWIAQNLTEKHGLTDVRVETVSGELLIQSPEDYLGIFGFVVDLAMNARWDEETRKAHPKEEVEALFRKHLEEKYGGKPWALKGAYNVSSGRKRVE